MEANRRQLSQKKVILKFDDGVVRTVRYAHRKVRMGELPDYNTFTSKFDDKLLRVIEWLANLKIEYRLSQDVISNATLAIGQIIAKESGGQVAITDDTEEYLVYVPNHLGHYVVLLDKFIQQIINDEDWDLSGIVRVQTIGTSTNKVSSKEKLSMQLAEAIENENYELAARLRDEVNIDKT